ncbi:MAG: ATPase [Flavobacterium sp. BFFFF1]|uniref:SRPBCC family protein n=1 Tax=Flavobacterium sp. BFFFF1 TaxID=2015557 RepID=UPI000BD59A4A|nr:SRPBCC domain-containing protein [Flavobacterium sp. BFFFF1]OYU79695.1 MAG: ATPase [Flavobacterium sp. BFFFF1]
MKNQDYTTTLIVPNSTAEVFDAINHVKGWWSESIDGRTDEPDAEFLYHYKDVHVCKIKIVEFVPNEKVVWLVLENHFNFTDDKTEWKGNKMVFEIAETDHGTELKFTQHGLTPEYECYDVCNDAWTSYLQGSLKNLITTGKGNPNTKDETLNEELIQKWNLPQK